MCQPFGEKFYQTIEVWGWDKNKKDVDINALLPP